MTILFAAILLLLAMEPMTVAVQMFLSGMREFLSSAG